MADAQTKKKRKPSVPRPLYVLIKGTTDEDGNADFELVEASRNAAVILEKLDAANAAGENLKLKKVMVG